MTEPRSQHQLIHRPAAPVNPWGEVLVPHGMHEVMQLACEASRSGFYKLSEPQALMVLLEGNQLGIAPAAALRGFHVIEGRPSPSSGLMATLVRQCGYIRYRVLERSVTRCVLEWSEFVDGAWLIQGQSFFDLEAAARMGKGTFERGVWKATKSGSNWAKSPDDMNFARAVSRGVRTFCPELTHGPLYLKDELEDGDAKAQPIQVEVTARANPVEDRGPMPEAELVEEPVTLDATPRPAPQETASAPMVGQPTQSPPQAPASSGSSGQTSQARPAPTPGPTSSRTPPVSPAEPSVPPAASPVEALDQAMQEPLSDPAPTKPLSAKERARAALDAEDAAAEQEAQPKSSASSVPLFPLTVDGGEIMCPQGPETCDPNRWVSTLRWCFEPWGELDGQTQRERLRDLVELAERLHADVASNALAADNVYGALMGWGQRNKGLAGGAS